MQQLVAKSQQIQEQMTEIKDDRMFEQKLKPHVHQLTLKRLKEREQSKNVKKEPTPSPDHTLSPPQRKKPSRRQQTPNTNSLNRNTSFEKKGGSLSFNRLSDQIKSVEFLLKANKINTISERDLQTRALDLAKTSSHQHLSPGKAPQQTLEVSTKTNQINQVNMRNSVYSHLQSQALMPAEDTPQSVRRTVNSAVPMQQHVTSHSYKKFKAHQELLLKKQDTKGTEELNVKGEMVFTDLKEGTAQKDYEEKEGRDKLNQSINVHTDTYESQHKEGFGNLSGSNSNIVMTFEKPTDHSKDSKKVLSEMSNKVQSPIQQDVNISSLTPRFDSSPNSRNFNLTSQTDNFKIQNSIVKVHLASVSRQQFSFEEIDAVRRAQMERNCKIVRPSYQKHADEVQESILLQNKLEQREFDRYLKRLQKLTQICKIDGLISNETMVNRCSYKRIERGPQKQPSVAQKIFNQKLINMLMQEEPIQRMNRGLIRTKGDSVKHLAREIFDHNNKIRLEMNNQTSQSFMRSSISGTDKKKVEHVLTPKTKSPPKDPSSNHSKLAEENQIESQDLSNHSTSLMMVPTQDKQSK